MKNVVSPKSPMLIKTREKKENERHLQCPNLKVADPLHQRVKTAAMSSAWHSCLYHRAGQGPSTKVPADRKQRSRLCIEWVINSRIIRVNDGQGHIYTPFNKAVKWCDNFQCWSGVYWEALHPCGLRLLMIFNLKSK